MQSRVSSKSSTELCMPQSIFTQTCVFNEVFISSLGSIPTQARICGFVKTCGFGGVRWWKEVLFVTLLPEDGLRWTKHTHRASITALCVVLWWPLASYSSCLSQLSLATTGTAFHALYNWITKTPSFYPPLLPSHVLEQGLALFMSQNSDLLSSFFKTFLIWRPLSFHLFLLWVCAFYTALTLHLFISTKPYTNVLRACKFPRILT
jgi:hypothetical protein